MKKFILFPDGGSEFSVEFEGTVPSEALQIVRQHGITNARVYYEGQCVLIFTRGDDSSDFWIIQAGKP